METKPRISRRAFLGSSAGAAAAVAGAGLVNQSCVQKKEESESLAISPGAADRIYRKGGKENVVLEDTDFKNPHGGWKVPEKDAEGCELTQEGYIIANEYPLDGPGVHTRLGDSIEIHFTLLEAGKGFLNCGYRGGMDWAKVNMDFEKKEVTFTATDWTRPQPCQKVPFTLSSRDTHVLILERLEGRGNLVRNSLLNVYLDGEKIFTEPDLNLYPETGIRIFAGNTRVLVRRFIHRGTDTGVPETLHLGGWQMQSTKSIEKNLDSLFRGLKLAADKGVQLLVTPETSITGYYSQHKVTTDPSIAAQAEKKIQNFMKTLKDAPYLVGGLPVWKQVAGHRQEKTRYNCSRVYDPDGHIVCTHAKAQTCSTGFARGSKLQEFDVLGVPICLINCLDARFPELWTLPVMFGARVILHPASASRVKGTLDAFEAKAKRDHVMTTSHTFYMNLNAWGGSFIVSPLKKLLDVSAECKNSVKTFPNVDKPQDCMIEANIRVANAFGYWPARSFRASEQAAKAYMHLYKAMGGTRLG
jgi:predicted amidohydrolase